MAHFDQAIRLTPTPDTEGATANTHPAWANMVSPFGGVTAATLVNAIQIHPEAQGRLLSVTVNFLGPLADGPWQIIASPVKTNRSNQHWQINGLQNDEVLLTATAVSTGDREGFSRTDLEPPVADEPAAYAPFKHQVLPWIENYEMRFVAGELSRETLPHDSSTATFWLKQGEDRAWDIPALVAASDAFFPRAYHYLGPTPPAGTVTLTTNIHASAGELASAGEYVLCTATGTRFARGYFEQQGALWSADRTLLATTSQMVYLKA